MQERFVHPSSGRIEARERGGVPVADTGALDRGSSVRSGAPESSNERRQLAKLCVFGCAPDTGNLGVSALCYSTITALKRESPGISITIFDHGEGLRWGAAWDGERALTYSLCGGYYSRRIHQAGTLWNIRACARMGGLGNPGALALLNSTAVLDVSGGDSFTDLYGDWRFRSVTYPKRMVLELGIPLILLPQTYGPFRSPEVKRIAAEIVRGARMAWARDRRSFEMLKELVGDSFDPRRHRCGVDLAFGLGSGPPRAALSGAIASWLDAKRTHPVIGLNVSGLIFNDPRSAVARYGLKADYREILERVISRFLADTSARIVLIPHVRGQIPEDTDGDQTACVELCARFSGEAQGRIEVLSDALEPFEIKHVIGSLDWFCGTRMHSAIAALSSGVPCAAIAYSGKTLGVFETCDQGRWVADPRLLTTEAACDLIWQSWQEREHIRPGLAKALQTVTEVCQAQMREIVDACAWSE